jgi:hypothetical protein
MGASRLFKETPAVPEDQRETKSAERDTKSDNAGAAKKRKYDWDDPAVPPGDAPAMPRWPILLGVAAWGAWLIFLIVMAVVRIQTTAI